MNRYIRSVLFSKLNWVGCLVVLIGWLWLSFEPDVTEQTFYPIASGALIGLAVSIVLFNTIFHPEVDAWMQQKIRDLTRVQRARFVRILQVVPATMTIISAAGLVLLLTGHSFSWLRGPVQAQYFEVALYILFTMILLASASVVVFSELRVRALLNTPIRKTDTTQR